MVKNCIKCNLGHNNSMSETVVNLPRIGSTSTQSSHTVKKMVTERILVVAKFQNQLLISNNILITTSCLEVLQESSPSCKYLTKYSTWTSPRAGRNIIGIKWWDQNPSFCSLTPSSCLVTKRACIKGNVATTLL